jgi:hypothetical protein
MMKNQRIQRGSGKFPTSSGSVTPLCEDRKTVTEGTSRRSTIAAASERDSQVFR